MLKWSRYCKLNSIR